MIRTNLVKLLMCFLALTSMSIISYAVAAPKVSDAAAFSRFYPQAGCRCCNFVYKKSLITCGKVCCVDGCC